MLLSVLICFYGKKISVSEFLRSARSSFLLFPIKKENRQRLYNLLSIFILKLIQISHKKKEIIPSSDNSFLFFLFYYLFIIPDGTLLHIPHSQFNCSPSGNTPPSSTMFARSIIFCTEDSTGSIIKSSVSPLE